MTDIISLNSEPTDDKDIVQLNLKELQTLFDWTDLIVQAVEAGFGNEIFSDTDEGQTARTVVSSIIANGMYLANAMYEIPDDVDNQLFRLHTEFAEGSYTP